MSKVFLFVSILLFSACQLTERAVLPEQAYPRFIGDSEFDADTDRADFEACHGDKNIVQYFFGGNGLQYEGEKLAMENTFKSKYKALKKKSESGLIRIRFVVNCNGETGRFRLSAMDENYNRKSFDTLITDQLMRITKRLDGWKPMHSDSVTRDYYQYLIFKLKRGKIIEILP